MKKPILFFLVLLAFSCSEEKTENDLSKENLFGKVKSVETKEFYAIDSSGVVVKDGISKSKPIVLNEYNKWGNLEKTTKFLLDNPQRNTKIIYSYNERNKLLKEEYYSVNDSLSSEVFYKYDENNNLIEWITYNDARLFNLKYIYKYDNQNNLIEELFYGDSTYVYWGKEVYHYDNQNKTKKISQYNSEEILRREMIYDKKENLIEETEYDSLNVRFKWTYKYDNKGNEIEENRFGADGSFHFKHISKYDDKGNLTERTEFNKNNNPVETEIYKYKYDKKGNWIEKIQIQNDRNRMYMAKYDLYPVYTNDLYPVYITERKIEYYD